MKPFFIGLKEALGGSVIITKHTIYIKGTAYGEYDLQVSGVKS